MTKKVFAVAVALVGVGAFAQEIGTEISPVTPGLAATPTPANNPYATQPPP